MQKLKIKLLSKFWMLFCVIVVLKKNIAVLQEIFPPNFFAFFIVHVFIRTLYFVT